MMFLLSSPDESCNLVTTKLTHNVVIFQLPTGEKNVTLSQNDVADSKGSLPKLTNSLL